MTKLSRLLPLTLVYFAFPTAVLAAPIVAQSTPMPSPSAVPTVTPTPTSVGQSTQNTIFFIVVAVLLVAIIWYILGMPDEEEDIEPSSAKPAAPKKTAPRRK